MSCACSCGNGRTQDEPHPPMCAPWCMGLASLVPGTAAGIWTWYIDSEVVVMLSCVAIIMASALVRHDDASGQG